MYKLQKNKILVSDRNAKDYIEIKYFEKTNFYNINFFRVCFDSVFDNQNYRLLIASYPKEAIFKENTIKLNYQNWNSEIVVDVTNNSFIFDMGLEKRRKEMNSNDYKNISKIQEFIPGLQNFLLEKDNKKKDFVIREGNIYLFINNNFVDITAEARTITKNLYSKILRRGLIFHSNH